MEIEDGESIPERITVGTGWSQGKADFEEQMLRGLSRPLSREISETLKKKASKVIIFDSKKTVRPLKRGRTKSK